MGIADGVCAIGQVRGAWQQAIASGVDTDGRPLRGSCRTFSSLRLVPTEGQGPLLEMELTDSS